MFSSCFAQAQALLAGFQADRRRVTAACATMADTELVALDRKRVLSLDAFLDVQRQHREQVHPVLWPLIDRRIPALPVAASWRQVWLGSPIGT